MKIAFVFPGQGSQHVGMAKGFYEKFDEVRALYNEASETLGYDVAALSHSGPEAELNKTVNTQPCLLTASIAAHRVLASRGIKPVAMAGHSLGEYSALVASGGLSFADGVRITAMRGRIMQEAVPEGKGMMAAILGLGRDALEDACLKVTSGYVAPVNFNCPGQIVIAGEKQAVEEAMPLMQAAGAKRVLPLSVSVPSHSKMMDEASKKLSEYLFLENVDMREPAVPLVSNADAIFVTTVNGIKAALVKQLNSPVLWEYCIAAMVNEGIDTFIEVGPGKVLSGLIKRCDKSVATLNVEDPASLEATLKTLGA